VALAACGRSAPSGSGASTSASTTTATSSSAAPASSALAPLDGMALDLWARAKDGEADDLARLANREGGGGLVTRASAEPAWRLTALRAMAYAEEPGVFAEFPWLTRAAKGADEAEANAALESVIDIAARPRRAVDPEDAAELREGCNTLLALAKDAQSPRARRISSIRALRMLVDRGCVKDADIPTDLDAH
jgi:hypothetical protein